VFVDNGASPIVGCCVVFSDFKAEAKAKAKVRHSSFLLILQILKAEAKAKAKARHSSFLFFLFLPVCSCLFLFVPVCSCLFLFLPVL
jgi:hypothetical protein